MHNYFGPYVKLLWALYSIIMDLIYDYFRSYIQLFWALYEITWVFLYSYYLTLYTITVARTYKSCKPYIKLLLALYAIIVSLILLWASYIIILGKIYKYFFRFLYNKTK